MWDPERELLIQVQGRDGCDKREKQPHQPNQGEEHQPAERLQADHREQPQSDGQKEPEDPQPIQQLLPGSEDSEPQPEEQPMQIQQSNPGQEKQSRSAQGGRPWPTHGVLPQHSQRSQLKEASNQSNANVGKTDQENNGERNSIFIRRNDIYMF